MTKANTKHIRACKNLLDAHKEVCPLCLSSGGLCDTANAMLDELCQAIANHKDCEEVQGCTPSSS